MECEFLRDFNDREVDVVVSFLISSTLILPRGVVGSLTYTLILKFERLSWVGFPLERYFGVKAPLRISFFVWMTTWGRILTSGNLMRRGYVMVG